MKRNLSILGSTGSIGMQTLDVVRGLDLRVCALAANSNVELLENQIREFKPQLAAVFDIAAAKKLKLAVADTPVKVVQGMDGLCEAAMMSCADLILNSVVGMVGLQPTLAAIESKKDVALANKETLVAGGALVMNAAKDNNVKIIPVDSEHSAIFQCLQGCPDKKALKRLILTASGGPFFGKSIDELRSVTPQQALKHPNWNMGAKVTIDSASLMDKGFEIIEAKWLFGVLPEQIQVVVHPQSIIHSMVQFVDGSIKAQLGMPDMKLPIQYAFTYPERIKSNFPRFDFDACSQFTFEKPDLERFRNLAFAYYVMDKGGNMPCILNAANEIVVAEFLKDKIGFLQMSDIIEDVLAKSEFIAKPTYEDYVKTDAIVRLLTKEMIR